MMQKKSSFLLLLLTLTSQFSFSKEDKFSLADEYKDLVQEVDAYLIKSDKTKDEDNQLIQNIRTLKGKISGNSRTYLEDINRENIDLSQKGSVIVENLNKFYTDIEADITILENSTGLGWRKADEDKRNEALTGLRLSIRNMYDTYSQLRILALSDRVDSDSQQSPEGTLALISEAKQNLKKGDISNFKRDMSKRMVVSNHSMNKTLSLFMLPSQAATFIQMKPFVSTSLANVYKNAQAIQQIGLDLGSLSSSNKRMASVELYKANYMLALSALQLSIAGNTSVVKDFADSSTLTLLPSEKKVIKEYPVALSLSVIGNSLEALPQDNEVMSKVVSDLLRNPMYRSMFYPVTGSMVIDSTMQALEDKKGSGSDLSASLIPLEQTMTVVPAPASDSLVTKASALVASFSLVDYSSVVNQVALLVAEASNDQALTYRNGDMNEVVALANLDLLQRVKMLILAEFISLLNYALEEIGKNQQDLLSSNFDKTLTLYKTVKPEAYQILSNRNNIIKLIISIENTRLGILEKLSVNIQSLDSSSKQLLLEEGIASVQFKKLMTLPSLLGSITAPLLIKDIEPQEEKTLGSLVPAIGLSLKTVNNTNQLQAMTLTLEQKVLQGLTTNRKDLLKLSEEMDRPFNEVEDHVSQELSQVESKIQELSENSGTDTSLRPSSRISQSLTKDFMDQVSAKASAWFNKLPGNQDMVTRAITKNVVGSGYSENEINYINGYLQGMAL